MPEEIVIIVLTAIIGGAMMVVSIVKMVLNYLSNKHQMTGSSSSLTKGELHGLIRDAVIEATRPLSARVDDLEQRLAAPSLPPARRDLLEGADGYAPEATPDAPSRQAVR